jgi:ribosomal protein S12 methylthiotransferase accessory factor
VRSKALRDALELGSATSAAGETPYVTPFAADALAALLAAHLRRIDRRGDQDPGLNANQGTEGADRTEGTAGNAGTKGAGTGLSSVYLLDLRTLKTSRWLLVPDAECPDCGSRVPDSSAAAEITLPPTPKRAADRFRPRESDEYGLRLEALVNPVCGVLGRDVAPDLASRTTSATVGSFTLRSGPYLRETFWGGHADNYAASTRIGMLEGFERSAGMRARGKRTVTVAAWDDLDAPAVDPRICGLYAYEFYRRNPWVRPFRADRPIPWVWGYSLRDRQPVLVPEILAYYHAPGGVENRFVQGSSSGCASGGCLAEAIYYGLMELVERDAFLIAWYGGLQLPEIDAAASDRPQTRAMADRLAMYGYRARFFDARVSFPIPVVVAAAQREDGGMGALCFGAGASLDPEGALAAGLCEIATDAVNLPWRTRLAEERLSAMADDFGKVEILHDHPLVYGLPRMARHAGFLLGERPGPRPEPLTPARLRAEVAAAGLAPSEDLRNDVERCVVAVTGAGYDVVIVDQTMPEQRNLGTHTVNVIVPGLLPIDFGWSRQRALAMPRLRCAVRAYRTAAGAATATKTADTAAADIAITTADTAFDEHSLNLAPHPFP